MTRESHAWWRYAAQVDGRPTLSAEDELLLNRDEEATRVATTTERLIRTQAAHPREFHRVLDDGAAIAGGHRRPGRAAPRPRVFAGRAGRPLLKGGFVLPYSTALDVRLRPAERALHGRATVARSVAFHAAAAGSRASRVELMAACERRRIVEVLQADRALARRLAFFLYPLNAFFSRLDDAIDELDDHRTFQQASQRLAKLLVSDPSSPLAPGFVLVRRQLFIPLLQSSLMQDSRAAAEASFTKVSRSERDARPF